MTLYRSQIDHYNEDEDEDVDYEFDPVRFSPGQLSFGGDGELFVATSNCINVLSAVNGKLKRQIGCDKNRDCELSKVEGICVMVMATSLHVIMATMCMCSCPPESTCVNLEGMAMIRVTSSSRGVLQ